MRNGFILLVICAAIACLLLAFDGPAGEWKISNIEHGRIDEKIKPGQQSFWDDGESNPVYLVNGNLYESPSEAFIAHDSVVVIHYKLSTDSTKTYYELKKI